MNFDFIELPNQTIYVNKYGIIDIRVGVPLEGHDIVISDKNGKIDWYLSKWYLRKETNEYHGGIGKNTKRDMKNKEV